MRKMTIKTISMGSFCALRSAAGSLPDPDLGQSLRDYRGGAIVAPGYSVQHVGHLHRPLLMRDDQDLGVLGEAPHQLQEPVEVDIVERRLDLVHQIERARSGLEDGEQEGQRGRRALPSGQERQSSDVATAV